MKKQRTKLAVLLLALGCASVGIGAGTIASVNASNSTVTASAEATYTTYDLGELKVHANSSNGSFSCNPDQLYLARPDGSLFPVQSWADGGFTLVSGDGLKVNGTPVAFAGVTSTDAGLFMSLANIKVGDIVTLSGTFVNETYATKYIIAESSFQWSGTIWENVGAYTTHEIGKLELHINSMPVGGAGKANNVLYLKAVSGETFPILDWSFAFIPESADGFKVNGQPANLSFMKSTADGMYFEFFALNAGDVVTIDGAYKCAGNNTRYILDKSQFRWTGDKWENYVEVEYTTYDIGKLSFSTMHPGSLNMAYFNRADGQEMPVKSTENNAHWENAFTFEANSGVGVTLNGQAITPGLKFPGSLFVEMSANPNAGDVMVIGGTFYNQVLGAKYIIQESAFKFNGTEWENYTVVNYTEYTATAIAATKDSNASILFIYPAGGIDAFPNGNDGEWKNIYGFVAGSGEGMKLNGVALTTEDIKLPGTDLFIGLGVTAKEGDIFTIDGSYANATTGIKLTFENCMLKFNGTAWETYEATPETPEVTYTEYTINKLGPANGCTDAIVYAYVVEGDALTVNSWDHAFTLVEGSGEGFALNGKAFTVAELKQPGTDLFINLGLNADKGDVLTVSGTFVSEAAGAKITFNNCALIYNGTAWEAMYSKYDIGALDLHVNSSIGGASGANNVLYLQAADGKAFPILDWAFLFLPENEDCFKLNGVASTVYEMKSTPDGMYFAFPALNAGDVITIGGTYVCAEKNTKYVIAESKFTWNGSGWEKYVEYTNYEIGAMKILPSSAATYVYLYAASEEKLPVASWDYVFKFRVGSGIGLTLNGQALTTQDIKSPGDMYIGLGVEAKAGDVLAIGGIYYNIDTGVAYVITESSFYFDGTAWVNAIDKAKMDAKASVDEYRATFVQENYYEAEWASFDAIVENAKATIDAAATTDAITAAVAAAKTAMDDVVTKAESDAIFDGLKESAHTDLTAYKTESDYRAAEWAAIQEIITAAMAEIKAADSVTAINTAVANAKTAMDAVKTAEQVAADEAAVAAAKADLAAYKTESAYKAEQWTEIQAIITEANTALDNAIGNQAAIDEIVANAKTAMDAVKTAEEVDADAAVVAAAKADLAAYKTEGDYKAAQWTEIQAIITEANADLDAAIGNQDAINTIVANAKAEMDKVKTAKVVSTDEVKAYYNSLDHSTYTEETETIISGYMSEVIAAINAATTVEEMDAAIAQFKTKVEALGGATDKEEKSSGCGGSLVAGGVSASVALAAAVAVLLKKKED